MQWHAHCNFRRLLEKGPPVLASTVWPALWSQIANHYDTVKNSYILYTSGKPIFTYIANYCYWRKVAVWVDLHFFFMGSHTLLNRLWLAGCIHTHFYSFDPQGSTLKSADKGRPPICSICDMYCICYCITMSGLCVFAKAKHTEHNTQCWRQFRWKHCVIIAIYVLGFVSSKQSTNLMLQYSFTACTHFQ